MENTQTPLTSEVIARNIKAWRKDLDSDEFWQCQGQLGYGPASACCLLVAAYTAKRLGYPVEFKVLEAGNDISVVDPVSGNRSSTAVPPAIAAVFGLTFGRSENNFGKAEDNPTILGTYQKLNDNNKMSFKQISAFIGEHLLPRFEKS